MTQSRKQALTELRDKVAAGNKSNGAKVASAFSESKDLRQIIIWHMDAFNGSLDAAKALHEAVSPGHRVQLSQTDDGEWLCNIAPDMGAQVVETVFHQDPARAWLLAILEALIAQEPDT